ncbi:MAG: hypothetical protein VB858_07145, partial [Planctomycetaceae bacterium]
ACNSHRFGTAKTILKLVKQGIQKTVNIHDGSVSEVTKNCIDREVWSLSRWYVCYGGTHAGQRVCTAGVRNGSQPPAGLEQSELTAGCKTLLLLPPPARVIGISATQETLTGNVYQEFCR